jgi:hypothetical protein
MPSSRLGGLLLDFYQLLMHRQQVDFLSGGGGAHVARYVEVVAVLSYLGHRHATGVAVGFATLAVGGHDFVDVRLAQEVLALALFEELAGVDEQHIVGLLALLEHQDADGYAGAEKQVAPPRNSTPWGRIMAMVPSGLRKWKACSRKAKSAADLGARPWLLKRKSSPMASVGSQR